MKKLLIVVLGLLIATVAFADETSTATYANPNGELCPEFIDYLNSQDYITHTHQYAVPERDDQLGIGVDMVVWENDAEAPVMKAVEIQEKYDFANKENAVYAVAKVNLWNLFKARKDQQ
jgi:hypothetical protein